MNGTFGGAGAYKQENKATMAEMNMGAVKVKKPKVAKAKDEKKPKVDNKSLEVGIDSKKSTPENKVVKDNVPNLNK